MKAFYFGYGSGGHFLRDGDRDTLEPETLGVPWAITLLDTGLLKNMKVPDWPDGKVYWTCAKGEWLAFVWWDRSGDRRPGSNSGFYVQGFSIEKRAEAFKFACEKWPDVVARQSFPLVLQP